MMLFRAWLHPKTDGSSLLAVNINFGEIRRRHDIHLITLKITTSDRQGFHRLIYRAGTDGLHLSIIVLAHDAGNRASHGRRTRPRRHLDNIRSVIRESTDIIVN